MIYKCRVCDRNLCTDDRFLTPGVAYLAVMTDDNNVRHYCCADCVEEHSGHGRFEGNSGRNALGKCLILYTWSLSSSEDDYMSAEGYGYVGKFSTYLLYQDERGFITYEEFATEEKAQEHFDYLYSIGYGYQEDDVVISEGGKVFFGGKEINVERNNYSGCEITDTRRYAAINLEMHRQGFFPNVWRETRYGVELDKSFRSREFATKEG